MARPPARTRVRPPVVLIWILRHHPPNRLLPRMPDSLVTALVEEGGPSARASRRRRLGCLDVDADDGSPVSPLSRTSRAGFLEACLQIFAEVGQGDGVRLRGRARRRRCETSRIRRDRDAVDDVGAVTGASRPRATQRRALSRSNPSRAPENTRNSKSESTAHPLRNCGEFTGSPL
jgi:hypothetical protein